MNEPLNTKEIKKTRTSHTVRNPAIGHRVTFLKTAAQTNGELLQILYVVEKPEVEPVIPLHIHLQISERFEPVSGQLGVILDGERRVLEVGQEVLIPPGTPHTFWNAGPDELRFITDVRPPGRLQTYWETVFGLAEEGKVGANGLPNLLQLVVLAPLADSYDPSIPLPLMKGLIAMLGGLGRLLGYRESYAQYSKAEGIDHS
jgi:mannose-6-phosphate isomerase-like protein (cupin superfamily)